MARSLRLLLATLLAVIAATLLSPAAAFADAGLTREWDGPVQQELTDPTEAGVNSQYLSINRWKDATNGFETSLDLSEGGTIIDLTSRHTMQSWYMSIGNGWWDAAMTTISWSSGMDTFSALTHTADTFAEQLMRAFIGDNGFSPLAVLFVVAIVGALIQVVKVSRGSGLIRRLLSLAIVVGYIVFAGVQLTGPSAPSQQDPANYKPAILTPSWGIQVLNSGVDKFSSISSAIMLNNSANPMVMTSGVKTKPMSCANVFDAFEERVAYADATNVQMRIMVDRMWQTTGLNAWITAQFGSGNTIGKDVFCYVLDQRSSAIAPEQTQQMYYLIANTPIEGVKGKINTFPGWEWQAGSKAPQLSMLRPQSTEQLYAATTALAACDWNGSTWTARDGFGNGFNPNEGQDSDPLSDSLKKTGAGWGRGLTSENIAEACSAAFSADVKANWWNGQEPLGAFIMPGNSASIDYKVQGPRTRDFISSFYGVGATSATIPIQAYVTFSPLATLPIILVSLAVIVMKIIMILSVITLWVAIVAALFSPNPWESRLKRPVLQVATAAIMAHGAAILLGIMMVFSQAMSGIGVQLTSAASDGGWLGSSMLVLITCISPVVSLFAMHYLWRKAFPGAPSPLSVKGITAWAKGSPAAAMAASAGVGAFLSNRIENAGMQAWRQAKSATSSALHGESPIPERKQKRRGAMGGGPVEQSQDEQNRQVIADHRKATRESPLTIIQQSVASGRELAVAGKHKVLEAASGARQALQHARTTEGRARLIAATKSRAKNIREAFEDRTKKLSEDTKTKFGLNAQQMQDWRVANAHRTGPKRVASLMSHSTYHAVENFKGAGVGAAVKKSASSINTFVKNSAAEGATTKQAWLAAGTKTAAIGAALAVSPLLAAPALAVSLGTPVIKRNKAAFDQSRAARRAMEAGAIVAEQKRLAKEQQIEDEAARAKSSMNGEDAGYSNGPPQGHETQEKE